MEETKLDLFADIDIVFFGAIKTSTCSQWSYTVFLLVPANHSWITFNFILAYFTQVPVSAPFTVLRIVVCKPLKVALGEPSLTEWSLVELVVLDLLWTDVRSESDMGCK